RREGDCFAVDLQAFMTERAYRRSLHSIVLLILIVLLIVLLILFLIIIILLILLFFLLSGARPLSPVNRRLADPQPSPSASKEKRSVDQIPKFYLRDLTLYGAL